MRLKSAKLKLKGNNENLRPEPLNNSPGANRAGLVEASLGRLLQAGAILGLSLVLCAGCAGYKLGPTNGMGAHEKSVQIVPFLNKTLQPRLTDEVAMQLRKELQRDGTFELATHDDGDIVVKGLIVSYERYELSFSPTDVLTVRDFRLRLKAQVTARDRSSGKLLLDNREVMGTTLVRVGNDITSAERQALPLLAQDLAKNVTALLADGSW